jgi:hypothetical protein
MNRIVHRDNSRELTGFWFEVPALLFVPSDKFQTRDAIKKKCSFRFV